MDRAGVGLLGVRVTQQEVARLDFSTCKPLCLFSVQANLASPSFLQVKEARLGTLRSQASSSPEGRRSSTPASLSQQLEIE